MLTIRVVRDPVALATLAKWGGTMVSFGGSLMLATAKGAGTSPFAFTLLFLGNIAWALAGIATRDRALIASSVLGMAFNLSATLIRL